MKHQSSRTAGTGPDPSRLFRLAVISVCLFGAPTPRMGAQTLHERILADEAQDRMNEIIRQERALRNLPSGAPSSPDRTYSAPSAAQIKRQQEAEAHARAVALNDKGVAAFQRGEWGIAAELFREAYRQDPKSQTILNNVVNAQRRVGLLAMENGEWDYAANTFQSLLLYRPDDQEFKDLQARARGKQIQANEAWKLNESGRVTGGNGDWAAAEKAFLRATELDPLNPTYRKNLGTVRETQAGEAWGSGDHERAMTLWRSALSLDPNNARARSALTVYGPLVEQERADKEATREAKAVVATIQQGMTKVADSVKAAKPAGGLGLDDFAVESGPFGTPVVRAPAVSTSSARTVSGTDNKAGDQLLAGNALARAGNDLTALYDIGGAPGAGSLPAITASGRPELAVLAAYPEKARNDPAMIGLARELAVMQAKRTVLDQERNQLVRQRNLTVDKTRSAELSVLVEQKEAAYQASLQEVFVQTEKLEARHRVIDTEIGPTPPAENPPSTPVSK